MTQYKIIIRCIVLCMSIGGSMAFGMHFSEFANIVFRPEMHPDKRYELLGLVERGFKTKSFDTAGCVANVLRIWDCDQNALKMLYGFPVDSEIGQLNMQLDATDDGVRGHFLVNGSLELLYSASVGFRYRFFDDFIIGLFLPFRSMRLSNVRWCDQTRDVDDQDVRVHELLTDAICANVNRLGDLKIGGWQRTGLGDLTLLLDWIRDFPQAKPLLKIVQLRAELGLTFPTGLKVDEDHIFALPFGADGSVGLLFGGGLNLTLGEYFRTGVDVELYHLFSNTKERRIKTNKEQTELLLLQKECALRDWGLTQQFTLHAELYRFYKGLSFCANYQYTKHGDDFLSLSGQSFSNSIANSAISLQDWTAHNAILLLTYDFGYDECADMRIKPQINLFAKIPFNGKRSALFTTFGGTLAIDF